VHEGLPVFAGKPVLVRLLVEERAGTAGYREAPPIERVLVAEDVMLVPRPPAAWARSSFVQWYLSRAWLVGGLVGGMLWMAVRVLG